MAALRMSVVSVCASVLAVLAPVVWSAEAPAVAAKAGPPVVSVERLNIAEIKSPDFQIKSFPTAKFTDNWLQVMAEFKVEAGDQKWLDELTFDWYVLLLNGQTPRLLLSRSITYTDIEVGQVEHSMVYVNPRTLRRYYSERGRSVSERNVLVYLSVKMKNVKVGEFIFPKNPVTSVPTRWWENPQVNRVDNGLLGREQTPFAPLDDDFYPPVRNTDGR